MANETCGWLIKGRKGNPDRLCVMNPGHKANHRDGEYREKAKAATLSWRVEHQEYLREYDRNRRPNKEQRREYERKRQQAKHIPSKDGFAYMLVSKFRPGVVKIGSTKDLKENILGARRYLPDAQHIRIYSGGAWLELRYLHEVFKKYVEPTDKRIHEWFAVPPEAVDAAVLILQILLQYPAFLMSKEPL